MAFTSVYEGTQTQTGLPNVVNHLGQLHIKTWFLAITMQITIMF